MSPPSAPLSSGPSGGKPSGRGLWVQTVPTPLAQECREQQGGLCAVPSPSQCPQPVPPLAPALRFPPCFFLVLFAGAAARKNVPRQHKRPQRAKFLSAVGKEETGAVVYREVGRLSPRSPFSLPCRWCMTTNLPLGLPLALFFFFFLFLFFHAQHPSPRPCHRTASPCWHLQALSHPWRLLQKRESNAVPAAGGFSLLGAVLLQPQCLVISLLRVSGATGDVARACRGTSSTHPQGCAMQIVVSFTNKSCKTAASRLKGGLSSKSPTVGCQWC